MKTQNRKLLFIFGMLAVLVMASQPDFSEKMNDKTQDLVVNKLVRVLETLEHSDASWIPTQQRLADVLAERARTRFMLEVEANCTGCKGSKEDRQKAIKIYEQLLTEIKISEHGPILFQLGHLYEIADQKDKAISLFEKIIKEAKEKSISPMIVSRSHAALGDLFFQKGNFTEAHKHYEIALKDRDLENKALTIYNMAWCDFNSQKLSTAISTLEDLLKNPSKITKDTEEGSKYDPVFHTDIVRDLGSFYARREITPSEIRAYESYSPQEQKKELLMNFAGEADRVGQKEAAHKIITRYLEQPDLEKSERLEAFVKITQINYDRGEVSQSTQDFALAASAFKKSGCDKDSSKCKDLQKTMKRYVTELHRAKKLKPDQDLLNAYVTYTNTFTDDKEMIQRASQVATSMGKFAVSIQLYRNISENSSFTKEERDEALLNEVTTAEKSQDLKLQEEAYTHFLSNATKNQKHFEVRYQHAYLIYQKKNLKEAAVAFDDLARDKSGSADLRKKSADLALDSLAQLKNDKQLQEWAWDYAELFPQNKTEFAVIARRSLMNQVATIANNPNSSQSDLKSVMKTVLKTSLDGATPADQILIYTNLSVIAQKLNDDEVYEKALNALINVPNTSSAKKEKYLEQLVGYYEKRLNFSKAYKIALLLTHPKISDQEQEFRLGTLADMSEVTEGKETVSKEKNAETHYKKSLNLGLSGDKGLLVRARLVSLSMTPAQELRDQAPMLRKKPSLLNEAALTTLSRIEDASEIQSVLNLKEISNLSAARFVRNRDFVTRLKTFRQTLHKSDFDESNSSRLQKSILNRIKLLSKADEWLGQAVKLKDITAELSALNVLAEENLRMVKDLARLDIPGELNAAQKQQYVEGLKMKSKPFLAKSKMAANKINELWKSSRAIAELCREYQQARPEMQKLMQVQLETLDDISGSGNMKGAVSKALSSSSSLSPLYSARKSALENPTGIKELMNLKSLESKMGHPLMSTYLEGRISQINKGKTL